VTLDLKLLTTQVRSMSAKLKDSQFDLDARRRELMAQFEKQQGAFVDIAAKVEKSWETCTWLLAKPDEPLNTVYSLGSKPSSYTVMAADGSQLDSDRHEMPMCCLINVGTAVLSYGKPSSASLESHPRLLFEEADLFMDDGTHKVPVQGARLAARRDIEEGAALVETARQLERDRPLVALVDGTLIRWTLESAEQFVRDRFLRDYLSTLNMLREMDVPVAGYISRPGSSELVGSLKVGMCPDETARCNRCSSKAQTGKRRCEDIDGFVDRHLFSRLQEGERSGMLCSMSRINVREYGEHRIHFFYLASGGELARVEVPQWVAENPAQLDLIHSVLTDQCAKGQGYPVALARAHERAVISAADRRAFLDLTHILLEREGIGVEFSRKSVSKQNVSL
jgi:hypothetical protein